MKMHSPRRSGIVKAFLMMAGNAAIISSSGCDSRYSPFKKEGLTLSDPTITDDDIPRLVKPDNINGLSANYLAIGDKAMEHLVKCTYLQGLHLHSTDVTDEGLRHINNLRQLELLRLTNTAITDVGLSYLADCTKLNYLDVAGTLVTKKGVDDLKMKIPGITIKWSTAQSNDVRLLAAKLNRMGILAYPYFTAEGSADRPNPFYCVDLADNRKPKDSAEANALLIQLADTENINVAVFSWGGKPPLEILSGVKSVNSVKLQGDENDDYLLDLQKVGAIKQIEFDLALKISSKGLSYLQDVDGLTEIKITSHSGIKNDDLETLVCLPHLESLILSAPEYSEQYTEATLAHVGRIPQLRKLVLINCENISDDAIKQFMTDHPQVKVIR
jgi:hypothetical protein